MSKLWGGRFSKPINELLHQFNASISFDIRMAEQDIAGSIAWANGLANANVISAGEKDEIVTGLKQIRGEIESGAFQIQAHDEDIHTAVERRLGELTGEVAGKLHTGRSRNDQAATDFRLWIMAACDELRQQTRGLQQSIIASAQAHLNAPMPGYTHLQPAQPITWGHFILSHFWALERDIKRLEQARHTADECVLGSAALAGTAFMVNRAHLAKELGFSRINYNSVDGVSNRDYITDFLYACAMIGVHLSRLSEQLILFAAREFSFVTLDDAYATGSSIMPQKKNPDSLELTRGKAGRLAGNLAGILMTLKGLPSTYDKDMQEDKEPVIDSYDTLMLALPVMSGLLDALQINPKAMAAQLDPAMLATDLADYLAMRGIPFRQGHEIVGKAVQTAEKNGVTLAELTLAQLQAISPQFGQDVMGLFNMPASLARRKNIGGTAPQALQEQLKRAKQHTESQ